MLARIQASDHAGADLVLLSGYEPQGAYSETGKFSRFVKPPRENRPCTRAEKCGRRALISYDLSEISYPEVGNGVGGP